MTEREFYDRILIELNKVEAPTLLIEDFVYFANKSVQQYCNQVYNRFDANQQSTDDLRVLQHTAVLQVETPTATGLPVPDEQKMHRCTLPADYWHLLNCVVHFSSTSERDNKKKKRCKNASASTSSTGHFTPARRLTADQLPDILINAYFKPSQECPYFYMNNQNALGSNTPIPKLEIRCGNAEPDAIYIDYLAKPKEISLTWEDVQEAEDHTRKLEFPDYVCYEIVNECVKLILENSSDARLQTQYTINKTIGSVEPSSTGK